MCVCVCERERERERGLVVISNIVKNCLLHLFFNFVLFLSAADLKLGHVGAPLTCSEIRLRDWQEGQYDDL